MVPYLGIPSFRCVNCNFGGSLGIMFGILVMNRRGSPDGLVPDSLLAKPRLAARSTSWSLGDSLAPDCRAARSGGEDFSR